MTAAQAQAALVIDDDAAAREAAAAALSEAGFMVKQAESGTRGLGKLIGFRPNLIVLDMTMPVMSGVDFCKQLIKYEIGDIPVLGVSDPGEKSQFEAKFDGLPLAKKSWAGKPLAKEALLKAARELTGQTAAAAVPQGPQKLRILLIDDEADIRSLLRLTLKAHHEIAEAENGMAGLAMLEQFQPDFVICDIMMPIMNGLETVEAIRKNPKFYDIPVFFLSGEKHPDLPELTMEAGGNLFLEKPIDPRRLMELVHLFVDEMGITPRVRDEMPKPAPPPKDAAPKPAPAPDETADKNAPPIRVLTIDSNAETLGLLRRILDNSQTGRWEPIWSEDAGESVANLYRLQPDLILYNPRQKMAGIAFLQNLHLRQILHEYEVCFVGTEISPAEEEYNRKISGCDPIRLDTPPEEVVKRIAERIRAARAKYKPKRHTLDELKAQEVKRDEALKSGFNELRKEQFQRMQEHINKTSA